jgi:hypothetical protein
VFSVVKFIFKIEYRADFSWLKPTPTSEESALNLPLKAIQLNFLIAQPGWASLSPATMKNVIIY